MTKGEEFVEKEKRKIKHCSSMSISAWCDMKSRVDKLKLHDKCPNPKCNCQNIITFTPHQYMLEGICFKKTMKKNFNGNQTAWSKFLKPALKIASPYIGVACSAKTKNPKVGQATANILKSISGGKILSLTDMHGNGLRLKVL